MASTSPSFQKRIVELMICILGRVVQNENINMEDDEVSEFDIG